MLVYVEKVKMRRWCKA